MVTHPWFVTDMIKTVLSALEIVYGLRVVAKAKRLPNRRLAMSSVCNAAIFFPFFLGARYPIRLFGWEAYLVLSTVAFGLIICMCLYTTILIMGACYATVRLRKTPPKFMTKLIRTGMFSIITMMSVAVVGVLVTEKASWASSRNFAVCLTAIIMGTVSSYGIYNLYCQVLKSHSWKRTTGSPESPEGSKSKRDENANCALEESVQRERVPESPSNSRAGLRESKQERVTVSPSNSRAGLRESKNTVQRHFAKQRGKMVSDPRKGTGHEPVLKNLDSVILASSNSQLPTSSVGASVDAVESHPTAGSRLAKSFRMSASSTTTRFKLSKHKPCLSRQSLKKVAASRGSHVRTVSRTERISKSLSVDRVIFKLRVLLIGIVILFPIVCATYMYIGIMQAQSRRNYPDRIESEQESYNAFFDASGYFGLIVNALMCFYAGY
mmetsp:Transcript_8951/g.22028  ORF Transcript_8951/g.22028 Transcript_8951/m.22028 type:complete len:438 (-) Transcript_8951:290-1603(-)